MTHCERCNAPPRSSAPLNRWALQVFGQAPPLRASAGVFEVEQWDMFDLVAELCDACVHDPGVVLWIMERAIATERATKRCPKCCCAMVPNTNTCPICDVS